MDNMGSCELTEVSSCSVDDVDICQLANVTGHSSDNGSKC